MGEFDQNTLRGRAPDDDIVLGMLDVIERDPDVTQRSVASELGIALGLANAYLKRCVRKGLIKVSQVPRRRYAYYLTPQGFAEKSRLTANYLSSSFSFFRHARAQCDEVFVTAARRGHRRLVLCGGGDLAEIAHLVAREHPVEIIAMLAAEPASLAAEIERLERIDAAVVTALVHSRETYEAALGVMGEGCVYAPGLLRLHARNGAPADGGLS